MPLFSFYTPDNIKKPLPFWCFKWVQKETNDLQWLNNKRLIMKWSKFEWGLEVFFNRVHSMKNFALYRLPVIIYHLKTLTILSSKAIFLNTLNNNAHIIKIVRFNKNSFMNKPCIQILKTMVKLYETTDLIWNLKSFT